MILPSPLKTVIIIESATLRCHHYHCSRQILEAERFTDLILVNRSGHIGTEIHGPKIYQYFPGVSVIGK